MGGGSGARRKAAGAVPSPQRRLYLWRRQEGVSVRGVRGAAVEIPVPRLLPPHLQPSLRPVPQAPHRMHRQAPPHRPRPALPIRGQPAPLRLQRFGGDEAGKGVGSHVDRRLRPQLRRSRRGPAAKVAVFPPQGGASPGHQAPLPSQGHDQERAEPFAAQLLKGLHILDT